MKMHFKALDLTKMCGREKKTNVQLVKVKCKSLLTCSRKMSYVIIDHKNTFHWKCNANHYNR